MAGILTMGAQQERRSTNNFGHLANMQRGRDAQEEQLEAAESNQRMQGAMSGAAMGTYIAPGVGTVIGAAMGFAAAYFL